MFSSSPAHDLVSLDPHSGATPNHAYKDRQMHLTIVGSGDAFGSGGRSNTCLRLDWPGEGQENEQENNHTVVVDFGSSALVAWHKLGFSTLDIDAVVLSHLHGDHFGGLPSLLLEGQFVSRRKKPLTIVGPQGLEARLRATCEALFPDSWSNRWSYPLTLVETAPGHVTEVAGCKITALPVNHPSGAMSRALRIDTGSKVFAYSGDTCWVDNLIEISQGADLFVVECYAGREAVPHHIDWTTLKANLPRVKARKIMATHMNADAYALREEIAAAGLLIAEDGGTFDL